MSVWGISISGKPPEKAARGRPESDQQPVNRISADETDGDEVGPTRNRHNKLPNVGEVNG